jgi:hypothetical protein
MTRRLCCLPSYRPQLTVCLVDLPSVLRRRASTYPLTFPPNSPPVDPTYVAPYPLTIEQIHQLIQRAGVFDAAVLLLCLYHTLFSLLLYPYCLGRFSFPYLIFLLLYSFFSLALLLFSLFCYMLCLLLGRLAVSARGDVLQSCSFGLTSPAHESASGPLHDTCRKTARLYGNSSVCYRHPYRHPTLPFDNAYPLNTLLFPALPALS